MRRASLSLMLAVLLPVLASAAPQEARTDEEKAIRDLNQAVEAHIQRAGTPGQPVLAVSIHASRHISDKALAALHHFGQLRRLNLADTQIGDDGLAHLQGLAKLERLDLSGTKIRGPGLAHLAALRELRLLDLRKTRVGDQDLALLGVSRHLRWVDVTETSVRLDRLGGAGKRFELRVHGQKGRLYATRTGKDVGAEVYHEVPRRDAKISDWAFSRDGRWIVTAAGYQLRQRSGDESIGEVRVWEVPTGRLVATYPGRQLGWVHGVNFGRDSRTVFFQAAQPEIDGP